MTTRVNGHNTAHPGDDNLKAGRPSFSWLQPHAIFVVIMVGPDEIPFGLQKDLLCAASAYFKRHFEKAPENTVEHVVKIPETTVGVFGLAQSFMYTQEVWPDDGTIPSYEDLFALWQLGQKYEVGGLCEKTLECMEEVKQRTRHIPGASLISRVWKETDEGTPIRRLFLQWAEEYFQSSDAPSEFAKSLPQEFLCELVVEMSAISAPVLGGGGADGGNSVNGPEGSTPLGSMRSVLSAAAGGAKRNASHLEEDGGSEDESSKSKKNRRVSGPATIPLPPSSRNPSASGTNGGPPRRSLPAPTKNPIVNRRISSVLAADGSFTDVQKVDFCADLLSRMLSGPGYWTRLVKPFRQPVDPVVDGVPDYFEKIEKPMDLMTIKSKMERQMYSSAGEFAADVRLIVENCKTYWKEGHPLYGEAEKFSKSFEEKFAEMPKWLSKMHAVEQGPAA
ncbi:hypothetical protein jhhlp_005898 [Lomentospora prolificans]|uniref:Bromo domain-containing protein n=1 Tax=Lomentospora prolificans TaxID=41688 RepID=A0A2N3N4E5_9PEZI|nr:hypothetical protein jhhlp_005898 [Lomentospora prolificans]